MRTAAALAALSLAALTLAGCLGSGGSDQPVDPNRTPPGTPPPHVNITAPNDTAPNATGAVEVKTATGTTAGVVAPSPTGGSIAFSTPTAQDNGGTFDVKAGVTAVVVEVAWNGTDTMYLYASPPCSDPTGVQCPSGKAANSAKSPVKVVVDDDKLLNLTGAWSWAVYPATDAQGTAFTAYVSIFHADKPKDDYTAVH
jgi:hypothetical protein